MTRAEWDRGGTGHPATQHAGGARQHADQPTAGAVAVGG